MSFPIRLSSTGWLLFQEFLVSMVSMTHSRTRNGPWYTARLATNLKLMLIALNTLRDYSAAVVQHCRWLAWRGACPDGFSSVSRSVASPHAESERVYERLTVHHRNPRAPRVYLPTTGLVNAKRRCFAISRSRFRRRTAKDNHFQTYFHSGIISNGNVSASHIPTTGSRFFEG